MRPMPASHGFVVCELLADGYRFAWPVYTVVSIVARYPDVIDADALADQLIQRKTSLPVAAEEGRKVPLVKPSGPNLQLQGMFGPRQIGRE